MTHKTRSELINEIESQALAWQKRGLSCGIDACEMCKEDAANIAQFKSNIDKLREKLGVKI